MLRIALKKEMCANLNMFVFLVASSHDQPIIGPCNNFQGIKRKAILFNYKAVVPSGLEWATGLVISILHKSLKC
jgi:hypothetical protein